METRSLENLLHTKGVVVYMAHPFGGSFENQIRARNLARSLTKEYPEATFINPLDNFIYMDRRSEEEILAAERFILAKCELTAPDRAVERKPRMPQREKLCRNPRHAYCPVE